MNVLLVQSFQQINKGYNLLFQAWESNPLQGVVSSLRVG